jgi:hypothetical protein
VAFYAVNLLQWVIIPQRLTCYYYYFPPAMFLGVAIVIVLSRLKTQSAFNIRYSLLVVIAAAMFFLYCYPRMVSFQAPLDCVFGCWS